MLDFQIKHFGIIGNPLGHSLSPVMHKFLLNEIGEKGNYRAFEVQESQLAETISRLKSDCLVGFNVTIPYKQTILDLLDEVDEEARFIGAVNTVHLRNNRLFGFNTDGRGFISAIKKENVQLENRSAIVLGSGGAARAVIFNLIRSGVKKLSIFNRTVQRAESLATEVRGTFKSVQVDSRPLDSESISAAIETNQVIINATSLGMWPDIGETPYFFEKDAAGLVAIDLIYNPIQTVFLKSALEAGAKTIDGLDMFIFQGAASLKIWLGLENDFEFDHEQLKDHLLKELKE